MPPISKPRVVKDYAKLTAKIVGQIKLKYPRGYVFHLITYKNHKGKFISALPFEAEDRHYLVRMTQAEAQAIISGDKDYDDDGNLKEKAKNKLIKKYIETEEDTKMDE